MNRWWARSGVIVTLSVLLVNLHPAPSHSDGAVFCTNCGTEWTQLLNKAMMAKQLTTQAQQLQTQLSQYQDMATNSQGVSQNIWGNAVGDMQKLNALFQQSKALAYSAQNLDSQFAQRYQGYQNYTTSRLNANSWQNKYNQWSQESSDNARYALKAAGAQSASMQNENAMMQQLQAMSGTAAGRMQAMQIANMMASQNIQQIQKLRQLVMTQLQMQANYYQMQQDKEDATQAQHERFVNSPTVSESNGRKF